MEQVLVPKGLARTNLQKLAAGLHGARPIILFFGSADKNKLIAKKRFAESSESPV